MSKRQFKINLEGEAIIELDDKVIDVVDDEWRASLYNLRTSEQIAEHIAYNLIINKWSLSSLDGWADQPDENAKVVDIDWYDIEADEL